MRKRRWKAVISWILIFVMISGYGNVALAAGTENAPVSSPMSDSRTDMEDEPEDEKNPGTESGKTDTGTGAEGEDRDLPDSEEIQDSDGTGGSEAGDGENTEEESREEKPEESTDNPGEDSDTDEDTDGIEEEDTLGTLEEERSDSEVLEESSDEEQTETEIPAEEQEGIGEAAVYAASPYSPYWKNPNFSNLVVFVDFSDTTHEHTGYYFGECVKENAETTFHYFNGGEDYARGMRQYLYNISYGQLRVENIFPQYDQAENKIIPYELPENEAYYEGNESAMVAEIIRQLKGSGQMSSSMNLHYGSNENVLDNLTIVVPCKEWKNNRGHKTTYFGSETVNGVLVRDYNVLTEDNIYMGYGESGLILHEFLHTLGYPDLYRNTSGLPVGTWDIMSSVSYHLQYPLAWLRSSCTKWFEIPTVTESVQNVSLYAASAASAETKDQQALVLKTDYSSTEFFVVEYRKKGEQYVNGALSDGYDVKIPGSGLIVYRVDTARVTNFSGPPDYIYIFRPGDYQNDQGREAGQGDIFSAALSSETGRTEYGSSDFSHSLSDGAITYSDGANSGIIIKNVGSASGDQITFDIEFAEPSEEEYWQTAVKEEDGAGTDAMASCMGDDGRLYFVMKKGNSAGLYRYSDGNFTRIGSAPSGNNYQLEEYDGTFYTAYLNQNFQVKLAYWTGSSWKEIYTSAQKTYDFSMASDKKGIYIAYADEDGSKVHAVQGTKAGVSALGSQVCTGAQMAANASIAAEDGTIVVMYREAAASNRLRIKKYDSVSRAWTDAGSQNFQANRGMIRINGQKIYLLKDGTTYGADNSAYLYCYDLQGQKKWEQVGQNAFAAVSILEMDLCFDHGEPYVIYMDGAAPYTTRVKRLQDGQWTDLGGSVVNELASELRAYVQDYQVYVVYRNNVNSRVFVKMHASDSADSKRYKGTVRTEQDKRWLYISDTEARMRLSEEEILECLQRQSETGLFDGISIIRTGDGQTQPDRCMSRNVINTARAMLQEDGELIFSFWNMEDGELIQWHLERPKEAEADKDGTITARRTGSGIWSLAVSDTDFPAENVWAAYSRPELEEVYRKGDSGENPDQTALYFYRVQGSRKEYAFAGRYQYIPVEESRFGELHQLVLPAANEMDPGISYEAETFRYDWKLEYQDVSVYYTSLEELISALSELELPSGICVRVSCAVKEQPSEICAELLKICADKNLILEFLHQEDEGELSCVWRFEGLTAANAYEAFDLRMSSTAEGTGLPEEFQERPCMQVWVAGKIPQGVSVKLQLTGEGIASDFAAEVKKDQSLCLWQKKGEAMEFLRSAEFDRENGDWISFELNPFSGQEAADGESYVLSPQSVFGWQETADENGDIRIIYVENRTGSYVTGWETIGNRTCFFDGDGYLQEGPAELSGIWYLFGKYEDGNAGILTGFQECGGKYYCADVSGVIQTGWQKDGEVWRYFSPETSIYGEEQQVSRDGFWAVLEEKAGSRRYYFRNNAGLVKGWQTIDGDRYFFTPDGCAATGWYEDSKSGKVYYFYPETGKMAVGYTIIPKGEEEHHYLFSSGGVRLYGWQKAEEIWHYFQPDAEAENYGQEMKSEYLGGCWYAAGGYTWYFKNQAGPVKGWQTIGGGRYYFDSQGRMCTGTQKIGSSFYHFRTEGALRGSAGTGLFTDGGETYYASASGALLRGWQKIEGIWQYFDSETGIKTESEVEADYWASVKEKNGESRSYYFVNGTKIATGWQTIAGKRYYFDKSGILQKGFFQVGKLVYYGRESDVKEDCPGEVVKGEQTIGGAVYYAGSNYALSTGWQKIGGVWRYFDMSDEPGLCGREHPVSGPEQDGAWYWYTADGGNYCFKDNRTLLKNWQTINQRRYYLDPASGRAVAGTVKKIGSAVYCFDAQGILQKNTILDGYGYDDKGCRIKGWKKMDGVWHYFDASSSDPDSWKEIGCTWQDGWAVLDSGETCYFGSKSSPLKGWQTIDRKRYYFDSKTGMLQRGAADRILTVSGKAYYIGEDGAVCYGWIYEPDGRVYYAGSYGVLAKGWQTIEKKRYCFDTSEYTLQSGYFQSGKNWYYFDEDGKPMTGWQTVQNRRCYFNKNGQALTGWQTIDRNKYYFDGDGILQTGKTKIGNTGYFFDPDGKMRTGLIRYCGTTYYYAKNGQMQKGWQTISGERYYFGADGAMATGFVKIGTATYYFGETSADRGHLLKGVQKIGGAVYDLSSKGAVLYGWQKIGQTWRFFDPETGKELRTEQGDSFWRMIYTSDGKTERSFIKNQKTVLKGWQTIEGKRYYFDKDGLQWTQEKGWLLAGGKSYYFDREKNHSVYQGFLELEDGNGTHIWYLNASGQMQKGWQTIKINGISGKHYFDPATGELWTGKCQIGKKWYYLDPDQNGRMAVGLVDVKSCSYYYSSSGVLQTGWQKIGGAWRYFAPEDGRECEVTVSADYWADVTLPDGTKERACIRNNKSVQKGWQTIGGRKYYFDSRGFQWTQEKGWLLIGKNRYYFDQTLDNSVYKGFLTLEDADGTVRTWYLNGSGQAQKGWQTIRRNGNSGKYYFDPSDGSLWTGHRKIGNTWYYLDPLNGGRMAVGYIQDETGSFYYYNTKGTLLTGFRKLNGETDYRYFDIQDPGDGTGPGAERALAKETRSAGKKVYHWYTVTDPACTADGSRYCFLNNTSMLKNRNQIGGTYYWFHGSTGALRTGDFSVGQKRYYTNEDGSAYTGFRNGNSYYNIYGERVTGWLKLKNENGGTDMYYLNANGVLMKGTCWIQNKYYVFDPVTGKRE